MPPLIDACDSLAEMSAGRERKRAHTSSDGGDAGALTSAVPAPALCASCGKAVTEPASLRLIGALAIQHGLPAGDPVWISRSIGEYCNPRVACPTLAGDEEDDVCAGGCLACCTPAACPTCDGGCSLCAQPLACMTCDTDGCERCVEGQSAPFGHLRILDAAMAVALVRGDAPTALATSAAGYALQHQGTCSACRDEQ